jgi:ribosomal protein S18 acetylase RimI-like enzyme
MHGGYLAVSISVEATSNERASRLMWGMINAKIAPAPITFRRGNDADLACVKALQAQAYARNRRLLGMEPLPLQADYSEIFQTMEVWLAEERNALQGVLILQPRADDLLIWSIAIAPDAQGHGLGPIMLDAAEVRARQLGRSVIRLYTGSKLDTLIGWYHRHGYDIERTEKIADRELTHMTKSLKTLVG